MEMFDPANHQSSITSCRRADSTSSLSPTNASGDSALTHISQILSIVATITQAPSTTQLLTTLTWAQDMSASSTPLLSITNSPSKLPRFLNYTETHLGITNACMHEQALKQMGYGPDILHLIDDSTLKDIGISLGDVIRLKQNSLQWWNGPNVKRKADDHAPSPFDAAPASKRIHFEKQYHEGGAVSVFRPEMVEGDPDPGADFEWYYFCKAMNKLVPLPRGYILVLNSEDYEW
jgi:hypothetical protein